MKEEDLIRKLTEGKGTPFQVPEGYFDSFTDRMMARLPQQPAAFRHRLTARLWRYAAAVVVVTVGLGSVYYISQNNANGEGVGSSYELYAEDYDNEVLDYALVGNQDIETFLTEASY